MIWASVSCFWDDFLPLVCGLVLSQPHLSVFAITAFAFVELLFRIQLFVFVHQKSFQKEKRILINILNWYGSCISWSVCSRKFIENQQYDIIKIKNLASWLSRKCDGGYSLNCIYSRFILWTVWIMQSLTVYYFVVLVRPLIRSIDLEKKIDDLIFL